MRTLIAFGVLVMAGFAVATPSKLTFPGVSGGTNAGANAQKLPANELFCWRVPAPFTITNATKLAALVFTPTTGTTTSIGIYPDDDLGPLIASATGDSAPGVLKASGISPFTLGGGQLYRLCMCSSSGGVVGLFAVDQAITCCEDFNLTQLMQSFHGDAVGVALNACTGSAALPTNTGSINPDTTAPGRNAPRVPFFLVE